MNWLVAFLRSLWPWRRPPPAAPSRPEPAVPEPVIPETVIPETVIPESAAPEPTTPPPLESSGDDAGRLLTPPPEPIAPPPEGAAEPSDAEPSTPDVSSRSERARLEGEPATGPDSAEDEAPPPEVALDPSIPDLSDLLEWDEEAPEEEIDEDEDDPDAPHAVGPRAPPAGDIEPPEPLAERRAAAMALALAGEHRISLTDPNTGPGTLAEALNHLRDLGQVTAEFHDEGESEPCILYRPTDSRQGPEA